jgi:eukaryotic-like serine/threonine-protein kinase
VDRCQLNPERWAQIEELFHRAAESDPTERSGLLDEACSNDPALRREVEVLLSCDGRAGEYVQVAVRSELDAIGFPLVGQTISHYRILEGVGGGGMGLVYRAEDIKLGRQVALKFLPEESVKDPAALARFEREARSASALEHPNICPIYEFGEHGGKPFLVMQLLEGQPLRELLESKREKASKSVSSTTSPSRNSLPLEQVIDLAIQIADGLDAAHKKGIIHRDIKPANIFVTRQGQAKILDFGLAKLAHGATEEADEPKPESGDGYGKRATREVAPSATPDPFLSRTGVAMGTAGYMSPEQARGEKLDARTDLFSFGLVLYEMATGHRAFEGDTGPALHNAILTQTPVALRELNPKLPAKLGKIITKTLEKNREARYQNVPELRADLQALSQSLHRPRWRGVPSGVVVLLLIAGTISWFSQRRRFSTGNLPDLKLRQLTINSSENLVTSGAISPDGKYLAYSDAKGMHIKLVGTDETQSVPQPAELTNDKVKWEILAGSWFPDSKRFFANAHPPSESPMTWSSRTSSVWIVSVLGGAPSKLRENAFAWSVSPDGSSISFGTNEGKLGPRQLWLVGPNGEQARKLYDVGEKNAICCLYFFPNAQRVSYISTDESGDTLVAQDLKGGSVATLLPTSEIKKMGDFLWLPDGRFIYSDPCNSGIGAFDTPCNYWIKRFDTFTGKLIEEPRRLTNWAGFWMNNTSATADSKRIAFLESSGRGMSYLADLEADGTRLANSIRFTLEEGGEDVISDWTADSKTVIVGLNRGDHYSIRKQSLNSDTQETVVASAAGLLQQAIVSPDGKWVIIAVWQSIPGSLPQQPLMRVPITGGAPELILQKSLTDFGPAFCTRPPSNLCAFAERTEDHKQTVITAFDPVKGRGLELTRFDIDPDLNLWVDNLLWNISPDGTRLAVARGPEGPIQIRSLLGGSTQVIEAKGLNRMRAVQWASDGKGLFVSNLTKDGSEILHLDLKGNTKVLWKCNSDKCFGNPSPDGRHLAIYERKLNANMWMMENF